MGDMLVLALVQALPGKMPADVVVISCIATCG